MALFGALCMLLMAGCQEPVMPAGLPSARRDINAVLADHDDQLLALPGVVGVYDRPVRRPEDSLLKVMLAAHKNPDLEASIPARSKATQSKRKSPGQSSR